MYSPPADLKCGHGRLFVLIAAFAAALLPNAFGHGTVSSPISRVYSIYLEGPNSPDTDAAKAAIAVAGPGPYYTWNQVSKNIANYADPQFNTSYAAAIPDGKLASGDSGSGLDFSGLDLVSSSWNWPATSATAGNLDITWKATAPHDPSFFKIWITKADYDSTTALAWDKMEFLGKREVGNGATKQGSDYLMSVTLPQRSGRHVLYVAWQRVDPVGEVFFSASDLIFGGDPDPGSPPVVSVSDVTVAESVGTASLTVQLSKTLATGETGTVAFSTSDGSATDGDDYTAVSSTVSFSPGELQKTVTVPISDDADEESVEVFSVALSNPSGLTLGTANATVTITDNDAPTSGGFTFDKTQDWGSGYQGWLVLANPGPGTWTNPVVTFDLDQTITFFGGGSRSDDGAGHHTVNGLSDVAPGGELRFDIVVGSVSSGDPRGPTNVRVNGTLVAPLPPAVSIADLTQPEGDAASMSATLTVSLSATHDSAIHVAFTTSDGSANAGTDYTATSGELEFAAGETSKTITVTYSGDTVSVPNKDFHILLSGVSGQSPPRFASGGHMATVTLEDDDGPIGFTATGGTVIEGDSGNTNLDVRMMLERAPKSGETVSIDYMVHGHDAQPGIDFVPTAGTFTFAVGQTEAALAVPVIGDESDEALEVLMMHFSNPVGLVPHTTEVAGQLIDDDFDSTKLGAQRVVAYIDATSGSLKLPPADRVTHLMYAFANLDASGNLSVGGPGLSGAVALKATNPDLRVLLSVGGWTWSSNFPGVAADAGKRANFAQSCRAIVAAENLDGIDLDWEWPGVPGGPGTSPTAQDGTNYTLLVAALRAELDDLEANDGADRHYEITAFTAASPGGIAQLELAQIEPHFDFLNVQGYDLHGTWNSVTGHNAGLHHNSGDPGDNRLNIESILDQYEAGGFPRSKLLVGAPFFARTFNTVSDTAHGLFQSHSGGGSAPLYRDILTKISETPRYWDAVAKVPFLYDRDSRQWTSYDDPQAMHEKSLFSLAGGYGGVYFWRNGGDTDDRQLLTAMSDTLAAPDADGDGLRDSWEREHFGNINTANPQADDDGDGQNNAAEDAAHTDPHDSADRLHLKNSREAGGQFEADLPTKNGVRYQLMRSTDLSTWIEEGSAFTGDGSTMSVNFALSETQVFLRVGIIAG